MDLPVEQPLANRRENVEVKLVSRLRTDPFLKALKNMPVGAGIPAGGLKKK